MVLKYIYNDNPLTLSITLKLHHNEDVCPNSDFGCAFCSGRYILQFKKKKKKKKREKTQIIEKLLLLLLLLLFQQQQQKKKQEQISQINVVVFLCPTMGHKIEHLFIYFCLIPECNFVFHKLVQYSILLAIIP